MAKATKESVNYSLGELKSHCGICTHFRPGGQLFIGKCEVVQGDISYFMWCKKFNMIKEGNADYGQDGTS